MTAGPASESCSATMSSIDPADVRLLAPVPQPEKYLGIGMNYRDHAVEAIKAGVETPPYQV